MVSIMIDDDDDGGGLETYDLVRDRGCCQGLEVGVGERQSLRRFGRRLLALGFDGTVTKDGVTLGRGGCGLLVGSIETVVANTCVDLLGHVDVEVGWYRK